MTLLLTVTAIPTDRALEGWKHPHSPDRRVSEQCVSLINLDSKNAVTGIKAELKSKEQVADISADEGVTAAIESYNESQKAILDEVIAISDIHFDGERQNVRTGPTNLACLITTAMVEATGADLAITNGGGIRASIEPGEITRGDIVTVLPFGNYIDQENEGLDILAALEHGLSIPNPNADTAGCKC